MALDIGQLGIRNQQMRVYELTQRADNFTLNSSWEHEIQSGHRLDDEWNSRVIESLMMRIPVGSMWLVDEKSGASILADGRRRLAAVRRFAQGSFELAGLNLAPQFNGLRHSAVKPSLWTRVLETELPVHSITAGTPVDVAVEVLSQVLDRPLPRSLMASSIRRVRN